MYLSTYLTLYTHIIMCYLQVDYVVHVKDAETMVQRAISDHRFYFTMILVYNNSFLKEDIFLFLFECHNLHIRFKCVQDIQENITK